MPTTRDADPQEVNLAMAIQAAINQSPLGHDQACSVLLTLVRHIGLQFPCCSHAIAKACMGLSLELHVHSHQVAHTTRAELGDQASH